MAATSSIPLAPPPWTCKANAYVLPFFTSTSKALPNDKIYAPLEAKSETWTSGAHKGGVGLAEIIRYSDTPVGTYDELVIMPGHFEAPEDIGCKGKYQRITGIWVSQETTCMNGRKNWNIPKHIARFKFTPTSSAPLPLKVEVFDPSSDHPFFAATIHPTSYTPTFSFSSEWQGYLGLPTKVLQPPLPTGTPPNVEVGTKPWMLLSPVLTSKKCKIIWLDMKQPSRKAAAGAGEQEGDSLLKGDKDDHWWPGIGRWRLGMSCEDAILEIGEPELFGV